MAILISTSTSNLSLTSADSADIFYGFTGADTFSYGGSGNLTMMDVSAGDAITLSGLAIPGYQAK